MRINPEFADLFKFKSKEEELEHRSTMISLRFVSIIEMQLEKTGLKRSELASKIGEQAAFMDAIFRGDALFTLPMLARIESVLRISFSVIENEDTIEDFQQGYIN